MSTTWSNELYLEKALGTLWSARYHEQYLLEPVAELYVAWGKDPEGELYTLSSLTYVFTEIQTRAGLSCIHRILGRFEPTSR